MEARSKWNSCRLAVHRDSGRVRWCVGQEKTWKSNLKKLTIFPIVLLTIVLLSVLVTHLYFSRKDVKTVQGDNTSELVGDATRDKLQEESGSFFIERVAQEVFHKREKREKIAISNPDEENNYETPISELISKDEQKKTTFSEQSKRTRGLISASNESKQHWIQTIKSASVDGKENWKTTARSAPGDGKNTKLVNSKNRVSKKHRKKAKRVELNPDSVGIYRMKPSKRAVTPPEESTSVEVKISKNNSRTVSPPEESSSVEMKASKNNSRTVSTPEESTSVEIKTSKNNSRTVSPREEKTSEKVQISGNKSHRRQKREAAFVHGEDFNSTELEKDYNSQLIEWKIPLKRNPMFNNLRTQRKKSRSGAHEPQEKLGDGNQELPEEKARYPVEQRKDELQREDVSVFVNQKRNQDSTIRRNSSADEENSNDSLILSIEENPAEHNAEENSTMFYDESIEESADSSNSTELIENTQTIIDFLTDESEDYAKCNNSDEGSAKCNNSSNDSSKCINSNENSSNCNNSSKDSTICNNSNEDSSKCSNSNEDSTKCDNSNEYSLKCNKSEEDATKSNSSSENSIKCTNSSVDSSKCDSLTKCNNSSEDYSKCNNPSEDPPTKCNDDSTKCNSNEDSSKCNNSNEDSTKCNDDTTKCSNSSDSSSKSTPNPNSTDHSNFWKNKHDSEEIRKTQANNMIKYMDTSTNPCEDFYQYACGNWHIYNPIPPDRSSFDTFEMLRESLDSVLRDLLEENVPDDPVRIDTTFLMVDPEDITFREKRFIASYDDFPVRDKTESSRRGENDIRDGYNTPSVRKIRYYSDSSRDAAGSFKNERIQTGNSPLDPSLEEKRNFYGEKRPHSNLLEGKVPEVEVDTRFSIQDGAPIENSHQDFKKRANKRFRINSEHRKKRESFAGDKMEERMKTLLDGGFLEEFRKEKKHGRTHWKADPDDVKKKDDVKDNGFVIKSVATGDVRNEDLIINDPILLLNEVTEEIVVRASTFLPGEEPAVEGAELFKEKVPLMQKKNIHASRFYARKDNSNDLDSKILKDAVAAEKMRSFSIDDFLGNKKVPNEEDAGTDWEIVSEEVSSTFHPGDIRSEDAALVDSGFFLEDDTSLYVSGLYENRHPEMNKILRSFNSQIPEVVTTTRIGITSSESSSEEVNTKNLVASLIAKQGKLDRSELFCNDVGRVEHFPAEDCEHLKEDFIVKSLVECDQIGKNLQPCDFYKTARGKGESLNSSDTVAADRKWRSEHLGQDFACSEGINVQLDAISFPIKENLHHEFPVKGNFQYFHPMHNYEFQNEEFPLLIKGNLRAVQDFDYSMKDNLRNADDYDFLLPEEKLHLPTKTNVEDNDFPMYPVRDDSSEQRRKRHIHNDFYVTTFTRLNPAPTPFYQYILNHSYPQPEDAITKAKYLFKSCMNENLIKTRGISPLLHLLRELGGWPVLDDNWQRSRFDFEWLLGQLRLYNNDIIISEWVGPDIRNSEEYVIQIDQSTLGLPSRDYFLDKTNRKYVDAYKRFIETVAMLLGADEQQASDDAEEIVEFEIELAAITVSAEHRKNVSDIYVRLKLKELHSIIPQIDWFKYIRIITRRKALPNDPIVTFSLNYLHRLVGLLSSSNPRTVCNYLLWRFIRHRVNNLDDRFQDAKQRFYKVLFGREQSPQRWQSCISQVNSNLGMALGSLFVRKYFDERSKNDTLEMTVRLRESFKELLLETDWLDVDTKKSAALKIDYMRLKIGYPNYILDDSQLDKRYKDVQIHPSFYFENTLSILQHLTRLEHSKLSFQVDKNFWNSPPAVVNAYYSRNKNQIMFPAGILQPPFYHRNFPRSLNYGGIGVVIGHEMTHGFDDKGRLFDKDGNLKVWWKKESIEEFHERSKCLIEQYNSYIVPEANMQMDGSNTQGENIADNGGIKQAFRAYKHFLLRNPKEENLPGLNLTNMQLFFLNFAQIWCGTTRPEAARNKLRTAVHSPGRFRVIGTLSNSEEFSKVYQCPTGSPMNPKVKCKIW